jgi:hypothetical protein
VSKSTPKLQFQDLAFDLVEFAPRDDSTTGDMDTILRKHDALLHVAIELVAQATKDRAVEARSSVLVAAVYSELCREMNKP